MCWFGQKLKSLKNNKKLHSSGTTNQISVEEQKFGTNWQHLNLFLLIDKCLWLSKGVEPAVSLKSPQLKGPHSLPRLAQIEWLQGLLSCVPCQWGTEGWLRSDGRSYGWGEGELCPDTGCICDAVAWKHANGRHSFITVEQTKTFSMPEISELSQITESLNEFKPPLRWLLWVQLPRVPRNLGWNRYLGQPVS